FVVPTPARATVAAVKSPPFDRLARAYAFPTTNGGSGFGSGDGGRVTVLDRSKVGSFSAFVLAASDGVALTDWLRANKFVTDTHTKAWLSHYSRMKFHFVAMRYDPPNSAQVGEASDQIVAETIRISFKTPLPYYPYFEPKTPEGQTVRASEMWLVSNSPMTPVAALREGLSTQWVQPFAAGAPYRPTRGKADPPKPPPPPPPPKAIPPRTKVDGDPPSARGNMWGDSIGESFGAGGLGLSGIGEGGGGRSHGIGSGSLGRIGHSAGAGVLEPLAKVLGHDLEALLPQGALVVQPFQDQKTSRVGFGDVLFIHQTPRTLSPTQRKALEPLLAILDPML
ncbi:MAG: DUF2330 domain-containing protein, partial [Polyangiaceae bacterium]